MYKNRKSPVYGVVEGERSYRPWLKAGVEGARHKEGSRYKNQEEKTRPRKPQGLRI